MAKQFNALAEHLARARIDFGASQLSLHLIDQDELTALNAGRLTWAYLNQVPSNWLSGLVPRVAVSTTLVVDSDGDGDGRPIVRIVAPDAVLNNASAYSTTGYAILIFKDTGTPSTSPLIGFDEIGSVFLDANSTYTYKSSTDGIVQIALP